MRVETSCRLILLCFLLILAPLAVQAAETEGADGVGSAAGPETGLSAGRGAGRTPDFGTVGESTADPNDAYARPSPFGFGAVSYQPGFFGCAVDSLGYSNSDGGGVYATLAPPPAPADSGRYLQFSLGASEIYTDNLTLAPDDRAISDFITEISPRMDACASTGRVRGNLSYQLQGLLYAKNSRYNRVYNNVAGDTTIELLAGHLYLDADTSYGQTVVDPSISYSGSNAIRPGNRTSRWITNISPYLFQSAGILGDATLRYRFGKVIYGDSDVPDSTVNGAYFNLASPELFDTWSWQVNAFTQQVRRSGGDSAAFFRGVDNADNGFANNADLDNQQDSRTTYFDKATLQLGYQLTRSLQLLALGGVEDDYKQDGTNDRLGSPLWNVGFRWASVTNSLEARVGHRFFGTSYYASATHSGRVLDASVDYTEEASTQGLNELNSNAIARDTSFDQPTASLFDRGVFVHKTVSASVGFRTALTQSTLTAYQERREFIGDIPDEKFVGGNLVIDYQFRPRTSIVPRTGWERRTTSDGFDTDNYDAGISLVRLVTPTLQAALAYTHSWRTSEVNNSSDYQENRVAVQVLKSF